MDLLFSRSHYTFNVKWFSISINLFYRVVVLLMSELWHNENDWSSMQKKDIFFLLLIVGDLFFFCETSLAFWMDFTTRKDNNNNNNKKGQQNMTFSLIFLYLVKYSFTVP